MESVAMAYTRLLAPLLFCQWVPVSYAFPMRTWLVPAIYLSSLASVWGQIWYWSNHGDHRPLATVFWVAVSANCSYLTVLYMYWSGSWGDRDCDRASKRRWIWLPACENRVEEGQALVVEEVSGIWVA